MLVEDFLTFTVLEGVVGIHLVLESQADRFLRSFITPLGSSDTDFEALRHLPTPLQFVLKHATDDFIFSRHFHAIYIYFVVGN